MARSIRQVAAQRAHTRGPSLAIPTGGTPTVRSLAPSANLKQIENHTKGPQGGSGRQSGRKGKG